MIHSSQRSSFKLLAQSLMFAAGLGLAASGLALAGDKAPRDPAARMAERLSLDESQKANVSAIFERHRPASETLRERHQAHRQAMQALDPKRADYSARAQALADEAGTLARDKVLQRTQLHAELATVLTAEQLAKFKEHGARGHRGSRHKKDAEAPAKRS